MRVNKPAFPVTLNESEASNVDGYYDGQTLLEHYAGLAMQGLLASGYNDRPTPVAKKAVACARALLNELENPAKP